MTEHREEHLELCAAYAVGNIDPADRQKLIEHLGQGCDACEAALADYGAATLLLAASAPAATPGTGLRERVLAAAAADAATGAVAEDRRAGGSGYMGKVGEDRMGAAPVGRVVVSGDAVAPAPKKGMSLVAEPAASTEADTGFQTPSWVTPPPAAESTEAETGFATPSWVASPPASEPPPVAAPRAPAPPRPAPSPRPIARPAARALPIPGGWMAATAVLGVIALILLITTINLMGALGAARREVNSNLDALGAINNRFEDTRRWSEVMSAPAARTASLAPTPDGGVLGRARAMYDPSTRRAVLVFDGLRAPQGKVFELWSIASTGPTSLGLIQTDSFGRAIVHIDDAGDPNELNAFAVSIESPGGSTNRHVPGPVVMLGRIEG